MSASPSPQQLREFAEFSELPEKTLNWLIEKSDVLDIGLGDVLFSYGEPIERMNMVLSGRISIVFKQGNTQRELSHLSTGAITGLLPYSRAKVASGIGRPSEPTKILSLHKKHFPEMISDHQELVEKLVHLMTTRVREFTEFRQQDEKLMALGKLSAGLAHELNNPAAAVVRSANALRDHLGHTPETFKAVMMIRVSPEEVDAVNEVIFQKIKGEGRQELGLMEKTEREDEIAEWLEDEINIEDGYEIAENFAEWGIRLEDLEEIRTHVPDTNMPAVLGWANNVLSTEKLVNEIHEASSRISELVSSVKGYTHMDKAQAREKIDVEHGIRSTLTMMGHKFQKGKIQKDLQFEENLPKIKAYGGELNQVWTNLIDNALDAMEEEGGTLTISASSDPEFIRVKIIDTGPGIPQEVKNRIFDPFFTTKDVGKGTGLGLDMVNKIVSRHIGKVSVDSQPGKTEFEVCLPIS